jgi:ABC-2 type transport system ATP-binding protein
VNEGESFGLLGPNGAGKTTTIKMLTGLIHPTGGSATLLGKEIPSPETMREIGFLPENPYVYPYLTPREFVSMCAHLSGVPRGEVNARVERAIGRVGMADAGDREVRKLSKGMTQRIGLAAALVHEPKLLILDEPMSGLDPVGRKEVRDLILEEKRLGRTVFFSTHVLADAEMLCDRVCILRQGKVAVEGRLSDLLRADARHAEVSIENASVKLLDDLRACGLEPRTAADGIVVEVAGDALAKTVCEKAWSAGAAVRSIAQKRESLEDLFVREAL